MEPCIPVMSKISHEISWWDISVVQVIQVIQVVQVNQPIQVMQLRLAHLWPDCRVIYCEILSKKSYQSYPRIPGGSNNGGGRCATAAAASTIGDHFRKSLFFHLPKEHHQNYFRKHSRPCLWPVRKAEFDTHQVLGLSLKRHAFLFIGNFLGI